MMLSDNNVLINKGRIAAPSDRSLAIQVDGGQNDILLAAGSTVIGAIEFLDPDNTLRIENVPSAGTALYAISGVIPNDLQVATERPVVTVDDGILVLDPTQLAAESSALAGLNAGLVSVLPTGLSRPTFTQTASLGGTLYAADPATATDAIAATSADQAPELRLWAEGFGAYIADEGDGATSDSRTRQFGAALGVEWLAPSGLRLGAFLGGADGKTEDTAGLERTDGATLFAGLQAGQSFGGTHLDASLTVGRSEFDRRRRSPGPVALGEARSDYSGVFATVIATAAHRLDLSSFAIEPSLTLGYSIERLGSYTETGSMANLSIDARTQQLGFARAGVALPITLAQDDGSRFQIVPEVGIEGRRQFGDTEVSGQVQGSPFTFASDSDKSAIGGFAGLSLTYAMPSGAEVSLQGEAGRETDGSHSLSGRARVSLRF